MAARQKKQVDERVENLQNKIYKEVYVLIMIVCSISILIKFFKMGVSLDNVITEWLIIFISSVYYYVRTAYLGILTDEIEVHDSNSKVKLGTKNVLFGVAFGLVFAIILGLNSAFNYADSTQQAIEYFFVVFLVSLLIYVPFFAGFLGLSYMAAKKKSDQVVQKNLED
ncbi:MULTISPECIES: DUF6773 family protein [unclassified Lysinibacillus]|uniref:DUF6773 family protein n=1 Tax=unclassified Lysinibacillus TaxID=2636778 RepID=UPI003808E313